MGELLDKLRTVNWWSVLKSLLFNGGASSTRWVFALSFLAVAMAFEMITIAACWVYIKDIGHPIAAMIGLIIPMATILAGFSSNSQNVRHQLGAQLKSTVPIDASSTPATGEVKGGMDGAS